MTAPAITAHYCRYLLPLYQSGLTGAQIRKSRYRLLLALSTLDFGRREGGEAISCRGAVPGEGRRQLSHPFSFSFQPLGQSLLCFCFCFQVWIDCSCFFLAYEYDLMPVRAYACSFLQPTSIHRCYWIVDGRVGKMMEARKHSPLPSIVFSQSFLQNPHVGSSTWAIGYDSTVAITRRRLCFICYVHARCLLLGTKVDSICI